MTKRLYIGGSPCSGKSTIAERLAKNNSFIYHSIDEDLEPGMRDMAKAQSSHCAAYFKLTPDGIWLREPEEQTEDEVEIYKEIFSYTIKSLDRYDNHLISEGAGFLPECMAREGIPPSEVIYITPSKEFQVEMYSKRPWIEMVLKDCSDKDEAFRRWMQRDILFAERVRSDAEKYGYLSLVTDGTKTIDEMYALTAAHFDLT